MARHYKKPGPASNKKAAPPKEAKAPATPKPEPKTDTKNESDKGGE